MKLGTKLIIGFLAIVVSVVSIMGVLIFELDQIEKPANDLQSNTDELRKALDLNDLALDMRYYDEVLTQSARNYAFTQNVDWKERYKAAEPELDRIIKRSIEVGDKKDKEFFQSVDTANLALVEMEYKSLDLVDQGNHIEAVKILESSQYWELKKTYAQGLANYISRHDQQKTGALDAHAQSITSLGEQMKILAVNAVKIPIVSIPVILALSAVFIVMISKGVSKPINSLIDAVKKISDGNFGIEIKINGNDELCNLAKSFNRMSLQLQKYTQKAELDKAKDEFMAMISHELKTPLVPITGYLSLLLANKYGELSTTQRDRLLTIQSSVRSLLRLISDLLDAQKIELGQLRIHTKNEDLEKIILETIEKTKPDVNKAGMVITAELQKNLCCICDKNRMEQVISNIIMNSLDFCQKGTGKIHITTKLDGDLAKIVIKDNGVGMTREKISKLFTKFYQGDNSLTREHGGTGLGLAVCKGIVESHGGKIWVASEGLEKGIQVHILLPDAQISSGKTQLTQIKQRMVLKHDP